MIRESREEKKIKAALRAQFRLKQRIEFIDWEMDILNPRVNEFLDRATLPEPPADLGIDVTFAEPKKPRARKRTTA